MKLSTTLLSVLMLGSIFPMTNAMQLSTEAKKGLLLAGMYIGGSALLNLGGNIVDKTVQDSAAQELGRLIKISGGAVFTAAIICTGESLLAAFTNGK